MTIQERKEGAKYLRRGDIAVIADQAGVHRRTVSLFKSGKLTHSTAEPYFIALVEKRKKEVSNRTK